MDHTNREYDVALSYASEDRAYVNEVASRLQQKRINVFYDEFEKTRLWGKNLYDECVKVYSKAKFVVIFVSESYSKKAWPRHELQSAQARAFQENREYLLPVTLDDTKIPTISQTIVSIDARTTSPAELSKRIVDKLQDLNAAGSDNQKAETSGSNIPVHPTVTKGFPSNSARKYYLSVGTAVLLVFTVAYGLYRYRSQELPKIDKPESCRAAIQQFQDVLGRDIDKVSLLAPSGPDKKTIEALNELQNDIQNDFGETCAMSTNWVELTKLTKVLTTIVKDGSLEKVGEQIVADNLSESQNNFVAYEALIFRAVSKMYKGVCDQPEDTLDLIKQATNKQRPTAVAYNLRGICRAEQSLRYLKSLKEHQSKTTATKEWKDSVDQIRGSLEDNRMAYESTQLAAIRFRGNRVWNSMQFLLGAMDLGGRKLSEGLQALPLREQVPSFKDMEAFFAGSLDDIEWCQKESQPKSTFYESEADLHAFELTYYSDPRYANPYRAQLAKKDLKTALEMALNEGLLTGKANNWNESKCYFLADVFLRSYVIAPEEDPRKYCKLNSKADIQIDPQVQERVDPRFRREIQVLVEDSFNRKQQ